MFLTYFREVLPVITMDSWNDPVIQERAAELCHLIDDHQFTPLFGLHDLVWASCVYQRK